MGSMFGGGKKGGDTVTTGGSSMYVDPNVEAVNKAKADFVTKYLPNFVPGATYGGKFTAPMTGLEQKGMDWLSKYLSEDTTKGLTGAATDSIMKTLTGGFDPNTSDFYKATRSEAEYNRRRAVDAANRDLGSRNKFFSTEALGSNADINAQTGNFLNKALASLVENERARQMQAVPIAQSLAQDPLQRANAGATLGGLPRTIQNLDLEKQYQDFVRQRNEMALPLGVNVGSAAQFYQNPTTYPVGSSGSSSFLGKALGGLAGAGMTWGLNAMAPGVGSLVGNLFNPGAGMGGTAFNMAPTPAMNAGGWLSNLQLPM